MELDKVKESFSIEIIEAVNSYTRAGALITVDNINYLIESADHSIKNGVHYVKLGLKRFGNVNKSAVEIYPKFLKLI